NAASNASAKPTSAPSCPAAELCTPPERPRARTPLHGTWLASPSPSRSAGPASCRSGASHGSGTNTASATASHLEDDVDNGACALRDGSPSDVSTHPVQHDEMPSAP